MSSFLNSSKLSFTKKIKLADLFYLSILDVYLVHQKILPIVLAEQEELKNVVMQFYLSILTPNIILKSYKKMTKRVTMIDSENTNI